MDAEYIAACETTKESIWPKKFYTDLEVVPDMDKPLTLYCDNSGAVKNPKNLEATKGASTLRGNITSSEKMYIEETSTWSRLLRKIIWQTRSRRHY